MIDFHGTSDQTIPYSLPTSEGIGPDGTVSSFDIYFYYFHNSDYFLYVYYFYCSYQVISFDGYYYYDKPRVIESWAEGLECGPALPWPTHMDGVQVHSLIATNITIISRTT